MATNSKISKLELRSPLKAVVAKLLRLKTIHSVVFLVCLLGSLGIQAGQAQEAALKDVALFGSLHDGRLFCLKSGESQCLRLRNIWARSCPEADLLCQELLKKKSFESPRQTNSEKDALRKIQEELDQIPTSFSKTLPIPLGLPKPQTQSTSSKKALLPTDPSPKKMKWVQKQVFKSVLNSNFQSTIQPWRRGRGLTAVDWNGDGKIDIFSVDQSRILLFLNQHPKPWKLMTLNLSSVVRGLGLIDVVVADANGSGRPQLFALDYPGFLYSIAWPEVSDQNLEVDVHEIRQAGRSFGLFRHPNGHLMSVISAWQGVDPSKKDLVQDIIVDLTDSEKSIFQKLSEQNVVSMGVGLFADPEKGHLWIARDMAEGSAAFVWDATEKKFAIDKDSTFPLTHHSSAIDQRGLLRLKMSTNVSDKNLQIENQSPTRPKSIDVCKKLNGIDKQTCLFSVAFRITHARPDLCEVFTTEKWQRFCRSQVTIRTPGLLNVSKEKSFASSLEGVSNASGEQWQSALKKVDQIWHIESLCADPEAPCFLMAERSLNLAVPGRLLFIHQNKNAVLIEDQTPAEGFDSTNFVLADFDQDGRNDLAFFSKNDFYFYRGQGSGLRVSPPATIQNGLTIYPQSGFMSRTFSEVPASQRSYKKPQSSR